MASYQSLLHLIVTHDFFTDTKCPNLSLQPLGDTAKLINNAGLLLKSNSHGFVLAYQADNSEALQLYVENEPLTLSFKLLTWDPLFFNYTQLASGSTDSILYFDNSRLRQKVSGQHKLHQSDYVSAQDYRSQDSAEWEGLLSASERKIKPLAVILLTLTRPQLKKMLLNQSEPPLAYLISFMARQTVWKYYLLGKLTRHREARIVDLDATRQFVFVGEEQMADESIALSYQSNQVIALQQRSKARFQLKESPAVGSKILIKRLPVASPHQIYREPIDGKDTSVSKIFINF